MSERTASVVILGNPSKEVKQAIQELLPEHHVLVEGEMLRPPQRIEEPEPILITLPKSCLDTERFKGDTWRGNGKRRKRKPR